MSLNDFSTPCPTSCWCPQPTRRTPPCNSWRTRSTTTAPPSKSFSTACWTSPSSPHCAPGSPNPTRQHPAGTARYSDPLAGPALRLIHDDPAHPWTVAALAAKAGSSRAAFARRFTALVGEPPMTYVAGWRIALAADLLRTSEITVETIAHQVGYANAFALSVAFKRIRGVSPKQYRTNDSPAGLGASTQPADRDVQSEHAL